MRKIQKIMISVFCAGVFLAGLGTGAAISEFSSFTYIGERDSGPVDIKSQTFEYTFEPQEDQKLTIDCYTYGFYFSDELVPAEDVPVNTLRFQVTYNAEAVRPYLYSKEENLYVGIYATYLLDDFKTLMINKDQILQDLKDKKICSFRTQTIKEIKILINPASMDAVMLRR